MARAVIFGAGCIGRGVLAPLLLDAGYAVYFVEAQGDLVKELEQAGRFEIKLATGEGLGSQWVDGYSICRADDFGKMKEWIGAADVIFSAVGSAHLPAVIRALAVPLEERSGRDPLPIILCENDKAAPEKFRLAFESRPYWKNISIHPASVETMAKSHLSTSVLIEERRNIFIEAESLSPLPKSAKGLEPVAPFQYYYDRKLFTNNFGHAALAFQGLELGYRNLSECLGDPLLRERAREAVEEAGRALQLEYGAPPEKIKAHIEDLFANRYANPFFSDDLARLTREPLRKLRTDERILGTARLVARHNGDLRKIMWVCESAIRLASKETP